MSHRINDFDNDFDKLYDNDYDNDFNNDFRNDFDNDHDKLYDKTHVIYKQHIMMSLVMLFINYTVISLINVLFARRNFVSDKLIGHWFR